MPPPDSGLGYEFALIRAGRGRRLGGGCAPYLRGVDGAADADLAAITRLDEVRTEELAQSRENLSSEESIRLANEFSVNIQKST